MDNTLKTALELYKKELIEARNCHKYAVEYSQRIDEETSIKGISFGERVPSSSIKLTPYINELIHVQASYEIDERHHLEKADKIMNMYKIKERMHKLNRKEKKVMYDIYFSGMTYLEAASENKTNKKQICNIVSKAIRKMMEEKL